MGRLWLLVVWRLLHDMTEVLRSTENKRSRIEASLERGGSFSNQMKHENVN